jgi:tRNA pseudouridine38-40 synthase
MEKSGMMNRYKLIFEYDGTDFNGWQKQPSGRTVEGEIEKAFGQLFQLDVDIIGQGRTDAGVHAKAQVAHVDLPPIFTQDKIVHAMKGILPADIALFSVCIVNNDFHSRFDAVGRRYQYKVSLRKSPLNRRYSWELSGRPDIHLLQKMAAQITGTHDFVNFCVPSDDEFQTTICTISESRWEVEGERLSYFIEGNRFLRHMVRRLTGSMIHVATGRTDREEFNILLKGKERKVKAFSAPARGLILSSVQY